MDFSKVVPDLTQKAEAEIRSRLITLLQAHVAPGYAVGGRWCRSEDTKAAAVDAAKADYAVVEALAAKGSPAIRERDATVRAEGRIEGRAAGIAESVLNALEALGIPVSEAQRQEILGCQDLDRLSRCLSRAALASSADEVTAES